MGVELNEVDVDLVLFEQRARQGELLGGLHLGGLDLRLRGAVAQRAGLEPGQVAYQDHGHGKNLPAKTKRARLVEVDALLAVCGCVEQKRGHGPSY